MKAMTRIRMLSRRIKAVYVGYPKKDNGNSPLPCT